MGTEGSSTFQRAPMESAAPGATLQHVPAAVVPSLLIARTLQLGRPAGPVRPRNAPANGGTCCCPPLASFGSSFRASFVPSPSERVLPHAMSRSAAIPHVAWRRLALGRVSPATLLRPMTLPEAGMLLSGAEALDELGQLCRRCAAPERGHRRPPQRLADRGEDLVRERVIRQHVQAGDDGAHRCRAETAALEGKA